MKVSLYIILIIIPAFCKAQETIPKLITDRPDQTESSEVVPIKSLQIETGFLMENDKTNNVKRKSFAYNTTLLRYGLFQNMELRLGLDYLGDKVKISGTDSTNITSGFAPLYTGFKFKIRAENGWVPSIAFLGGLVFPITANNYNKPTHSAANMCFSFSHTLSTRLSLGYNLGVEWDGETAIPDYFFTVSLGIGITDKIGGFVEGYGQMPEEGEQEYLANAGITYLFLPNLQLDVSGGIGIYNGTDSFVSFGLSYRLPK